MAKTINFTYKEKEYTLEFTRHTIEVMESQGVVITNIEKKIFSSIPMLFKFSFLAHHKRVKQKEIDEIFNLFANKEQLASTLFEMLNETITTLLEEPDDTKNAIKWEMN